MPAVRRPRAVFLGFAEVAGSYRQLALGLQEVGVRTMLVTARAHPFAYGPVPHQPWPVRIVDRLAPVELRLPAGLRRRAVLAVRIAFVAVAFAWALVRCDAFVIGFPYSSMNRPVLRLLRLLRRRVITVFHGGDHRPPFCDGAWSGGLDGPSLAAEGDRRRRTVAAAEAAGWVIGNPLSGQLHSAPLIGFQVVGIATDPSVVVPRVPGAVPRVLHAPSKTTVKGTHRVRAAVEAARAAGVAFDYEELVGVPNDAVRQALARCDLVFDQTYSDTTMAGLAAEAAEVATASLFGSYAAPQLAELIPEEGRPPAVGVVPDDLTEALLGLLADPKGLRALGDEAQRFVNTTWARTSVAERYLRIFTDGPEPGWLTAPDSLPYHWGCGLEPVEVASRVAAILAEVGPGGLCLDAQPRLRSAYVEIGGG